MGINANWTDEEINILKKMVKAGKSNREIQKVLTIRTREAINKKANDLGISLAKRPTIDMKEFNRLMGITNGS